MRAQLWDKQARLTWVNAFGVDDERQPNRFRAFAKRWVGVVAVKDREADVGRSTAPRPPNEAALKTIAFAAVARKRRKGAG